MTHEEQRLEQSRQRTAHWKRWGPYLSERQWGTVREDYSPEGTVWDYFPHEHARSRAYRWGEDGIAGICDRRQLICFALAFWNGRDPILKERLFGLTGNQGNHGEDVKEYYFYLDSTPTHSYMKYLYKYPQAPFPYTWLEEENRRRGKRDLEFELVDTGVFNENRYFDIFIEYAKAFPEDILVRITAYNRGPASAELHLLPTLWFRNTWSWGRDARRPALIHQGGPAGVTVVEAAHYYYPRRWLVCEGSPPLLFTENETNTQLLFGVENRTPYVKDGIDNSLVHGQCGAVNPSELGTKAAAHYRRNIAPGESALLRLRFTDQQPTPGMLDEPFETVFDQRIAEAEEFYAKIIPRGLSADARNVQRQALAGMLWSKQFYHYDVHVWLEAIPHFLHPHRSGSRAETTNGNSSTTLTLFRCPTSGSTPGTLSGTSPSIVWRWRWWTPTSPKSNLSFFCASGSCIPTASFRPTSGRSATSTLRYMPGRLGAFTRSRSGAGARPIANSWKRSFTSCS